MQKGFCLLLIWILVVSAEETMGQETPLSANGDSWARHRRSPSRQQPKKKTVNRPNGKRVVVFLRNGDGLAGFLVGADDDALTLIAEGRSVDVPYPDLKKVVVDESRTRPAMISGMLMTIYLGNLVYFTEDNASSLFFSDYKDSSEIASLGLAAAGSLMGYLFGSSIETERVFDFTSSQEQQQVEWKRLQRFARGEWTAKKVHLVVQGGRVYPQTSSRYRTVLGNSDFSGPTHYRIPVNLLRQLQLTVSATNRLELGIGTLWAGEPNISIHEQGKSSNFATQSLDTKGYYIIAKYKPFLPLSKRIQWNVGLGMGGADVDFRLRAEKKVIVGIHTEQVPVHGTRFSWGFSEPRYETITYPIYNTLTKEHNISKTLPSGVIFSELKLYLHDGLSLGLSADYVFMPNQQAPGIPEVAIPAQKLRLGNGSIGLTLGVHF
jgi:hypothetical protein